jgi:hypothetical protein
MEWHRGRCTVSTGKYGKQVSICTEINERYETLWWQLADAYWLLASNAAWRSIWHPLNIRAVSSLIVWITHEACRCVRKRLKQRHYIFMMLISKICGGASRCEIHPAPLPILTASEPATVVCMHYSTFSSVWPQSSFNCVIRSALAWMWHDVA